MAGWPDRFERRDARDGDLPFPDTERDRPSLHVDRLARVDLRVRVRRAAAIVGPAGQASFADPFPLRWSGCVGDGLRGAAQGPGDLGPGRAGEVCVDRCGDPGYDINVRWE